MDMAVARFAQGHHRHAVRGHAILQGHERVASEVRATAALEVWQRLCDSGSPAFRGLQPQDGRTGMVCGLRRETPLPGDPPGLPLGRSGARRDCLDRARHSPDEQMRRWLVIGPDGQSRDGWIFLPRQAYWPSTTTDVSSSNATPLRWRKSGSTATRRTAPRVERQRVRADRWHATDSLPCRFGWCHCAGRVPPATTTTMNIAVPVDLDERTAVVGPGRQHHRQPEHGFAVRTDCDVCARVILPNNARVGLWTRLRSGSLARLMSEVSRELAPAMANCPGMEPRLILKQRHWLTRSAATSSPTRLRISHCRSVQPSGPSGDTRVPGPAETAS